jgi:hypothetical protein
VHAAFFVPVTTWAIGVIVAHGVQLSRTISLARSARLVSRPSELAPSAQIIAHYRVPARPPRSRAFLTALLEPMLPWDLVALTAGERAQLQEEVSTFVDGQIAALPRHLQLRAAAGLFAVRWLFQLATAGRFARLGLDRRARLVERWAFGRAELPRQLFRLLRGPALLAFCDHPLVAGKLAAREAAAGDAAAGRRLTVVGEGPLG